MVIVVQVMHTAAKAVSSTLEVVVVGSACRHHLSLQALLDRLQHVDLIPAIWPVLRDYVAVLQAIAFNFGTCDSDTTPVGTTTVGDPRPLFGSVTYSSDIYDCVQANVVALTYDDGPYIYTNQLLDTLDNFGFKATFFITGNNLGKGGIDTTAPYPALIKRMVAAGHQVASHTWSHYDLSTLTGTQRVQQMVKNERAIANIIDKYPTYMRPPYSSCTPASGCTTDMQALGYHRTFFDLDTQDYLNNDATLIRNSKNIVNWALGNASQGSDYLSIQHDIDFQSVTNLSSYYFELIRAKGWTGVTVGQCLGDPETNWYRIPGTGQAAPVSLSVASPSSSSTSVSSSTSFASAITSSSTITPSTATTSISTTTAPVATPSCDFVSRQFCGQYQQFYNRVGCNAAQQDCLAQWNTCLGVGTRTGCAEWKRDCYLLSMYCGRCGRSCSTKGFRASQE
ncbi:MAG: hypothetical protein GOMPHAMPRED_005074 [Gomphillus americanus]|uniref:NodB homology domain-containing protein n=1 Tax=Gomphillus americanus TaxID=1940652 RepID=A0A8H3ENH9_9LECA|nr:MAG: hypothetical protein GOMPHAMPRED_005074 [Gomphillus americanus]